VIGVNKNNVRDDLGKSDVVWIRICHLYKLWKKS